MSALEKFISHVFHIMIFFITLSPGRYSEYLKSLPFFKAHSLYCTALSKLRSSGAIPGMMINDLAAEKLSVDMCVNLCCCNAFVT